MTYAELCNDIANVLRGHRLLHTIDEVDEADGLALVDALTPKNDQTITRGNEEIDALTDALAEALFPRCTESERLLAWGTQLQTNLKDAKVELGALRAAFNFANDGVNVSWCGQCGSLLEAVRPGKYQCQACEMMESLRDAQQELQRSIDRQVTQLDKQAKEIQQLRTALLQILQIENQPVGLDWGEIEEARCIAKVALGSGSTPNQKGQEVSR